MLTIPEEISENKSRPQDLDLLAEQRNKDRLFARFWSRSAGAGSLRRQAVSRCA